MNIIGDAMLIIIISYILAGFSIKTEVTKTELFSNIFMLIVLHALLLR